MAATQTLTRAQTVSRSPARVAGVMFFVLAAGFLTIIMLGASMAPGYDLPGGAISDLGAISETALLFNVTLVGVGVLNLAGGYLFFRTHRRPWILALFALAGLGAIGAGLVPLGTSDLHGLFALLAFLFFNLEAMACAIVVTGPMRWVSVLGGLLGLVFVVIMVIGDSGNPAIFGPVGHGGAERMIVYPAMLWMIALGGYLMGAPADAMDQTEPARR
jgi:hypothetical membrane protein